MRILSYIDFFNQFSAFKDIFFFFLILILFSEMANQDDSYDKCLSISRYISYGLLAYS